MRQMAIALSIISLSASSLLAYDWPIKEDTVQHQIHGTLGEWRSSHFHAGVDVGAPESTKVYTIEGDTCYIDRVNGYGSGINIGHFRYYHMVIRDTIQDSTWVGPDSLFAKTDGENHVHLQEADVILRHPGDLDDVTWLNPLREGGIEPYEDTATTAYPEIRGGERGIKYWRQGTNNQIVGVLSGKVDISVDARDSWIDSLGRGYQGGIGNMGVYKCDGYIFAEKDTQHLDTLKRFEYHIYDESPPDENVEYAYAPGSYTSRHIYFITNNPFDTLRPEDYYWNTKQKLGEPDSEMFGLTFFSRQL